MRVWQHSITNTASEE